MASSACFLNNLAALSSPAARATSQRSSAAKSGQVVCRSAQKQSAAKEDGGSAAEETTTVSRRLALAVLIGAAAVESKVSPADAAYGESGSCQFHMLVSTIVLLRLLESYIISNICMLSQGKF